MSCEACPCVAFGIECYPHPDFCRWAMAGEIARFNHIVGRSRIAIAVSAMPVVERPVATYPSLPRQLATAAGAVGRVIEAVATGQPVLVPIEKQQDRLAICRACEFLDVEQARCTRCGCHLPGITGKTALATEACPIGKW